MKILAIETSCDETAICIVDASGDTPTSHYRVLGNALFSQAQLHEEYGGVYPSLAKREHAKNLPILLHKVIAQARANGLEVMDYKLKASDVRQVETTLTREPEMCAKLLKLLNSHGKPSIDYIAITHGPGLEPALWIGITFAEALGRAWNVPVIPINHMEGHIVSAILDRMENNLFSMVRIDTPALALLISGGHTELVLMRDWLKYEIVGETRDDAVGEAFDKVARMLGLPYPGGPEISKLAQNARTKDTATEEKLPRPMIQSNDCDFSFSGLKTSVLYRIRGLELTQADKEKIAREFEDAVVDVLVSKSKRAIEKYNAKSFIIGGGVSANIQIKEAFQIALAKSFPGIKLHSPAPTLSTDNAIMIAVAAHLNASSRGFKTTQQIAANGNLRL